LTLQKQAFLKTKIRADLAFALYKEKFKIMLAEVISTIHFYRNKNEKLRKYKNELKVEFKRKDDKE
jgi:hypothetical protein